MDEAQSHELQRELLAVFGPEATEHLQVISRNLLALEASTGADDDAGTWRATMRAAHSLKGAARAVMLTEVETIAHRLESVFTELAEGRLEQGGEVFDVAYQALDVIGMLVRGPSGAEPARPDITALVSRLEAVSTGASPVPAGPHPPVVRVAPRPTGAGGPGIGADAPVPPEETVRLTTAKLDTLLTQMSELQVTRIEAAQRLVEVRELDYSTAAWEEEWRKARIHFRTLALSAQYQAGQRTSGESHRGPAVDEWETIRLLLRFLEANEHHLGSLRIATTSLTHGFTEDTRHMAQVTADMEDGIRQTRMLPVATVLDALPRVVRDLARDRGKDIALVVEGGETGADRSVLEQIKDPLLHLLRNAVDHGIETPQARVSAGKPPRGTITITVAQHGDSLSIEVADDGAGVDLAAVRATAVKRRTLSEESAAALDDREALWLIFDSGLSTSPIMTEISGRGVGLDCVRESVEHLHGTLEAQSTPGQGITFTLTLPLTVASTDCLLVQAGNRRGGNATRPLVFAIPIKNVIRLIRATPAEIGSAAGRPAIRVDDEPLALWHLTDLLGLEAGSGGESRGSRTVIVVGAIGKRLALLVDAVLGAQETVNKPLPPPLHRVRNVAGATILGTGQVVVILRVADLFSSAQRARPRPIQEVASPERVEDRVPVIMVVDDSITTRTLESNILRASGYATRLAADASMRGRSCWRSPATSSCRTS
ncbi:MAG: chemotaxis protein CheA [Cellulomonas sp.]